LCVIAIKFLQHTTYHSYIRQNILNDPNFKTKISQNCDRAIAEQDYI